MDAHSRKFVTTLGMDDVPPTAELLAEARDRRARFNAELREINRTKRQLTESVETTKAALAEVRRIAELASGKSPSEGR
jgi:uncharacterized protein YlxW (UPF0749 family)